MTISDSKSKNQSEKVNRTKLCEHKREGLRNMEDEVVVAVVEAGIISSKLAPYWYGFVVRGLVLTGFGLSFIFFPASTWTVFSTIFGIFCLIDGCINIGKACAPVGWWISDMADHCSMMSMFLLGAICNTFIGVTAIRYPFVTAEAMLILLAIWLIIIGAVQFWFSYIVGASQPDSTMPWCMGLIGILFLVTGTTFLFNLCGNVGFLIFFVGLNMIMLGLQTTFFGVALKRTYNSGAEYTQGGEATASTPLVV